MKVLTRICFTLVISQLGGTLGSELVLENLINSTVVSTCNGVLNTTSGGIAYKTFQPIAATERCVWTIRGGGATGFSVNVLHFGISNSSDIQLIATCVPFYITPDAAHVLLDQKGPVSGLIYCNILIITLASGSDVGNSTGFVLEYVATGSTAVNPRSLDYIVQAGPPAIIRHPFSAQEYENLELNTFVILPVLGSFTIVMYFKGTLEGRTCYDNLSVHRFIATSVVPTKWHYEGRICGNVTSKFIGNDDLILITFDSDSSVVGTGFQLAVSEGGECQCRRSN